MRQQLLANAGIAQLWDQGAQTFDGKSISDDLQKFFANDFSFNTGNAAMNIKAFMAAVENADAAIRDDLKRYMARAVLSEAATADGDISNLVAMYESGKGGLTSEAALGIANQLKDAAIAENRDGLADLVKSTNFFLQK